jgi:SAM-dependent methyltransferase
MNLLDLVRRTPTPEPWSEGDNIPWHDPGFSARMLKHHFPQGHDAASRRSETIDRQVRWIQHGLLGGRPTRILDLGCGPGLYASRLARLGHACTGIDFGPASVAYAVEEARREALDCTYHLADIRTADYGDGYGLAMLIYGEFNIFRPGDAGLILDKVRRALAPGGLLLLEPHTAGYVEELGREPSTWYTAERGLFSDRPHLQLEEHCWDVERRVATTRHYTVDAENGEVTRYASSMQTYTDDDYRSLLEAHGYGEVAFFPSLAGPEGEPHPGLFALVAKKV